MERSNFSLRLLPSLLKAAQRIAEHESCSVNQLINVALAEKIAVLEADRMEERRAAARTLSGDTLGLLTKLGSGTERPRKGDELPKGFDAEKVRRKLRQERKNPLKVRSA